MDFFHKILTLTSFVLFIAFTCLTFAYKAEKAQNDVLRHENAFLDQTLKEEQMKAQKAISEANDRIAQYELDKTRYIANVQAIVEKIEEETRVEEEKLVIELQKDSSSDNQLKLVEVILHDFSTKR